MYILSKTGSTTIAFKLKLTEEELLKLAFTSYHSNEFFYVINYLTEAFDKTDNGVLFATDYQFELLKRSYMWITEI